MSDVIPVQGRGGKPTSVTDGVDNTAPIMGGFMTFTASGSGAWTSTEATDTMDFDGSAGIAGPWVSAEVADFFDADGYLPIVGTWASTEAADAMEFTGITAPNGDFITTENADTFYANRSPLKRLEIVNIKPDAGGSFRYTTTERDLIIVIMFSCVTVGVDHMPNLVDWESVAVTNHPEIKFIPEMTTVVGPIENDQWLAGQILWAYAPEPLNDEIINFDTYNINNSIGGSTSATHVFSIKGLNGNFNNPFNDPNPFCRGSGVGALFPTISGSTAVQSFSPVVTGSINNPSVSSVTFDNGLSLNTTLGSGDLVIHGTGSGGAFNSYAIAPASQAIPDFTYIEVTFDTIANGNADYGAGLIWYGANATGMITNNGLNGLLIKADGTLWSGGTQYGSISAPDPGDTIGIAVSVGARLAFVRNVTKLDSFSGHPEYAGYGSKAAAGGIPISGGYFGGPPNGTIRGDSSDPTGDLVGGYQTTTLMPVAFPGSSGSTGAQTWNFGATPMQGAAPSGYSEGYAIPVDLAPARITYPSVVIGMAWDCNWSLVAPSTLSAPSGYTEIANTFIGGSQSDMRMVSYAQVRSQNILETDNDFQIGGAARKWAMQFDTLVVGTPNPGDWTSTEAADNFVGVGYLIPGTHGVMSLTEAKDTMAFVGNIPALGELTVTEATDIFSMFIKIPIQGTFNRTEATDTFHSTGIGLGEDGEWHSTENLDIFSASGTVPISGPFDTFEAPDRFLALGAGVTRVRRRRSFFVS